ncbi:MAG: stage II sporulation protein M [Gammaproteobacteria bacterium]|nr:stage II sporulation protein M [Gammaproteobacteria bacterium]MBU1490031.1 stage II sporulation protein M [Gammaproteobacteria bacterium]MBU2064285.1 stage II sporulation protein M [Gammaproteobacteria bacterium]MBU2137921.1 stage II sporulation protein M [Gammaproteobacteria bacterium]MBU2218144.1 stage II sporulation protein M [Gammaproteobacteria bacterium]
MKQQLFEQRHRATWQALGTQLEALERGQVDASACKGFAADYRNLCQHLALAQARGYSNHLIDELEHLALRGHQQFYRHRSPLGAQLIGFLLVGFPRLVRAEWRHVMAASLLFFSSLLGMGLLVYAVPELVYSLVSPDQVANMEQMYDPDASRLGRFGERDSGDDWVMFGYYIMNNIGIAFQTFASGLLLGLGSLFFLLFNGLMIGAVAGHLTQIGYGQPFWSFVIGHGAFELTAIALAGAAGFKLGWALLAPGRLPRGTALRQAAAVSVRLIGGVIMLLLLAAFIEAYWSSMTFATPTVKYAVGAGLWVLVLAYLLLSGRDQHAPD